ncbi:MAG: tRNA (N6-threonylcarbamoyladenosine(37)-N6)-methyltransferase TrmO [Eubacterium sp.]|nr:tRNA (N6-threonylcarbamoyladenosine(37)-N6)-methyltransferase TrmO [Eubacterium sp.]
MEIKPVAYIHNDFKTKFAVPRQSGISDIPSTIVFEKEYCDENAVRGIEGFSHLWLIWGFSENIRESHSLTVRPPRLGGNVRLGVFATRSPFRPNNLGLSSVKLVKSEFKNGTLTLTVNGADLIDGTPIYDIKPYVKYSDSHADAVSGFADSEEFSILKVEIDSQLLNKLPKEKRQTLLTILENDPRPAYQNDSERVYGFEFAEFEIKFTVEGNTLKVKDIYAK